jgi:hypothetical protein
MYKTKSTIFIHMPNMALHTHKCQILDSNFRTVVRTTLTAPLEKRQHVVFIAATAFNSTGTYKQYHEILDLNFYEGF